MDQQDSAKTETKPTSPKSDTEKNGPAANGPKRKVFFILITLVLAVIAYFGLRYFADTFTYESTDDAFLDATVVSIAPRIAGQIKTVYVGSNQQVKKGDPLVEIDPRDYDVLLAQKKAAQAAAEANVKVIKSSIGVLGMQVATTEATAKQFEAEASADQATAAKANADLKRAEDLFQKQVISPEEYDAAKAAAASANATLQAGQQKAISNRSKVEEIRAQLEAARNAWDRANAQAHQASAEVQQAELNLSYAHITSPIDGHVTRKAVENGDYVQVGQRLMALVANDIYVVANFKETELRDIQPGQPVTIRVDSVGGRLFAGHVQSIQAGSGAAFSLLPPENAVGNYIKVVQRVPVKILFDKPVEAEHVLGPGMSVVPSIKVSSFEIPDVVVAIVALILAAGIGFLWWKKANNKEPQAKK